MRILLSGGAGFTRPQRLSKLSLAMAGGLARNAASTYQVYYTYVLKSEGDGQLYTGWTDNLEKRLAKHASGKVPATKRRLPVALVYYEACLNQRKAIAREKYFKTGFGRRFLKNRL